MTHIYSPKELKAAIKIYKKTPEYKKSKKTLILCCLIEFIVCFTIGIIFLIAMPNRLEIGFPIIFAGWLFVGITCLIWSYIQIGIIHAVIDEARRIAKERNITKDGVEVIDKKE